MTRIVIVFLGGFMKNKLLVFLLLLFTMAVSGCGESIFEIGGNDKSPEALDATIKKAFMDKDYDTILSIYSSDNYTYFSDEAAHNYVAALLGKGGFNIINGLDFFFGNNTANTSDMYQMIYSIIGIDNGSIEQVNTVKSYFNKAANVCNTVTCTRLGGKININTDGTLICSVQQSTNQAVLDNSTAFVCSLSGAFGTVTNLSNTVNTLADIAQIDISNIDITSQAGIQEVVNQIESKGQNLTTLAQNLTDDTLKDLANTLSTLDSNLGSFTSIVGNIDGVNEVLADLKDTSSNSFTTQSLIGGLEQYLTSIGSSNNTGNTGNTGGNIYETGNINGASDSYEY